MSYYKFDKHTDHTQELLFIAAAVLKNDPSRDHLMKLYSTGVDIVATDGHRLHVYTPQECPLPAGYYEIKKKTKTVLELLQVPEAMQYPDYKRFMQDRSGSRMFPTHRKTSEPIGVGGKFTEVIRSQGGNTFDYKYFEDACLFPMTDYLWKDATSPLALFGDCVQAIIMPVKYL